MSQHVCEYHQRTAFRCYFSHLQFSSIAARFLFLLPQCTGYSRISGFLDPGWFFCLWLASCLRNTQITDTCSHIRLFTWHAIKLSTWIQGAEVGLSGCWTSTKSSPHPLCKILLHVFSVSKELGKFAGHCSCWGDAVHPGYVCFHCFQIEVMLKFCLMLVPPNA